MNKIFWKVHTWNLFKELATNPGVAPVAASIQILANILAEVARRAAEINDPELTALMCRLTLYAIADPQDDDYDPDTCETIYRQAYPDYGNNDIQTNRNAGC